MNDTPKFTIGNFDMNSAMGVAMVLADYLAKDLKANVDQFQKDHEELVAVFEPEFFDYFITSLALMVLIAFINNNKEACELVPNTLKMVMEGILEGTKTQTNPGNSTLN